MDSEVTDEEGAAVEAETALNDHDTIGVLGIAQTLVDSGKSSLARELLARASQGWDAGAIWTALGDLAIADEDSPTAFMAYHRALELSFPAHVQLGLAYESVGQLKHAEQEYRFAIANDEEVLSARVNLGLLKLDAGNFAEAEDELLAAARIDAKANWQLADVYVAQGRDQEALWVLDAAISAGELLALHDRAVLTQSTRAPDDVIADFEGAIEAGSPVSGSALVVYLDTVLDDLTRAREVGERQAGRGDTSVYSSLAIVLESLGDLAPALHYYDLAIADGAVEYSLDAELLRAKLTKDRRDSVE